LMEDQRNPQAASPTADVVLLSRLRKAVFSLADQALFVGASFLANVTLARTQTKEEYGMFALSYSVFTFLTGLHNAAILEPGTVYGSGRYRNRFSEYLRLMVRSNARLGLVLSVAVLLTCLTFSWIAPRLLSRSLWGLGWTVGILLGGIFLRRAFYLEGKAIFAAGTSLAFFLTVAAGLWLTVNAHVLNSFSVFLVLAFGWIVAGAAFGWLLPCWKTRHSFLEYEPRYWAEHWQYTKWVLVTAFVFQFTTQGYYWLVAAFLSVKDVAELRAIYLLIAPVDQIFIALSLLLLPMLSSRYARGRTGEFLSLWRRYALATVAITAFFVLSVRAIGKPTMHLVYGGKFDGLATMLFTLALLPLLMGVGNSLSVALSAMEKPKLVFLGFLSSGVATFALGIPLVMHFGLRGAVYGMLVSGGTYTAALAVAFLVSLYKNKQKDSGEHDGATNSGQHEATAMVVPSTVERVGVTA
jgi:O-antigen/teichoic acid export membrane protein